MTKTKEMLAVSLAGETGMTKVDAANTVDAVFDIITRMLSNGDKLQIVGFGTFEIKERAARVGRNPRTNEQLEIPARRVPTFKPGKVLKDSIA